MTGPLPNDLDLDPEMALDPAESADDRQPYPLPDPIVDPGHPDYVEPAADAVPVSEAGAP